MRHKDMEIHMSSDFFSIEVSTNQTKKKTFLATIIKQSVLLKTGDEVIWPKNPILIEKKNEAIFHFPHLFTHMQVNKRRNYYVLHFKHIVWKSRKNNNFGDQECWNLLIAHSILDIKICYVKRLDIKVDSTNKEFCAP